MLTVISNPFDPKDQGVGFPITLYRQFDHSESAKDSYLIDAPPELEEHPEWYRQMFYGFLALGMKVYLGAVTHEDTKRHVMEGPNGTQEPQQPPHRDQKTPPTPPRETDAEPDCPGAGQEGEVIFQEAGGRLTCQVPRMRHAMDRRQQHRPRTPRPTDRCPSFAITEPSSTTASPHRSAIHE